MTRELIKNNKGKVVAFIEQQKNGEWGYAFGNPNRDCYIMFYVADKATALSRVFENID